MNSNPQPNPILQPGTTTDPIVNDNPSDGPNPNGSVEVPVPDWLPSGWRVKRQPRPSGVKSDTYYYDPVSKHWFRSRTEVTSFLETGVIGSRKKKRDAPVESSPQDNKRKTTVAPKATVESFKYDEAPKKVKWVMTNISKESWKPLIGGVEAVPKSTQQQWVAAYKYLTLRNDNDASIPKQPVKMPEIS